MENMLTKEQKKEIGPRVKEVRKSKSLNQVSLAELAGISITTLQKIEQGSTNFSINVVKKIAAALNVSPVFLMPQEIRLQEELRSTKLTEDQIFKLEKGQAVWGGDKVALPDSKNELDFATYLREFSEELKKKAAPLELNLVLDDDSLVAFSNIVKLAIKYGVSRPVAMLPLSNK